MSSLVPRGFGSFPAFASSPRSLLALLGLPASGAGTWSVPTQGTVPADGIGGEIARTSPGAAVQLPKQAEKRDLSEVHALISL